MGTTAEQRKAVFDLYCENEHGEKFIVELQKTKQPRCLGVKDRTVYYSTFPIREQAEKGSEWNFELQAVYTIALLDFVFDEDKEELDKYRYNVKLSDVDNCKVFYDKLTFIYLEIPKFKKELKDIDNRFEKWLYIIRNLNKLERIPDELREGIFERLFEIAEIAKFSQKEANEYEDSLKSYRDLKNSIDTAREETLQNRNKEIIMNSITLGSSLDQISKITNLPLSEIKRIKDKG